MNNGWRLRQNGSVDKMLAIVLEPTDEAWSDVIQIKIATMGEHILKLLLVSLSLEAVIFYEVRSAMAANVQKPLVLLRKNVQGASYHIKGMI